MKGHAFSKKQLKILLDNALNKTLGEVDVNNVFDKTKTKPKITGIAGDVIEQSVLGFPADNKQRPDLDVDGIPTELKTTGIRLSKKNTRRYEAKEPMSITAVSPNKIVWEAFDNSNFWHKLENMLLVYYHYNSKKTVTAADYANFYIRGYEFHEFNDEDKARLENDWLIVRNFIKELQDTYEEPQTQYPRLSSELRNKLVYIDTAPKWPNPPRFRLKRQVVTSIVQNHFGYSLEQLPGHYYSFNDIDNKLRELTKLHKGKTISELIKEFGIEIKDIEKEKNISEQIVVRMFGGKSKKMSQIEMFSKIGLICKSITLTSNGLKKEDTKLFTIDFDEWTNKGVIFEESFVYDFFKNNQLIFTIFKASKNSSKINNRFVGFKRLSFDDKFINANVKKIWEEIRYLINEKKLKEEIRYKKNNEPRINKNNVISTQLNFPKSKDNIVFVRGTGDNSSKKPLVLNEINMYRQNIWIKGKFIVEELNKIPLL